MPITLPPISRRAFLAGSIALAAGLRARAQNKPTDPHRFALLSDVHVAGDRTFAKEGACPWDALTQAVGEILALPALPAAAIVNGDLAFHKGEPEDYATFLDAIAPLRKAGLPVHLAMGNHDRRDNFWQAVPPADDAARQKDLDDRQILLFEAARANFVLLDSLGVTAATPGALGERQLAWLAKTLDAKADKPAIVFVHHDPGNPLAAAVAKPTGLTDVKAFYDVVVPRKQVKAYVFGHTHDWHKEPGDAGLHLVNLPTTAWVFKAGKPRGWTDLKLTDAGATFELRCLDPKHPQHGQTFDLKWR
jgi:Icc-related predicted phosphoesterase